MVVIDNSIASALRDGSGKTDLDRSLDAARAFLRTIDPGRGDTVGVVSLGAPGEPLVWPPTADIDTARRALDRVKPTDRTIRTAAMNANAMRRNGNAAAGGVWSRAGSDPESETSRSTESSMRR